MSKSAWRTRSAVEGARVLDAFAGTGALGLEALSRGAARATFIEQDRGALMVLRRNLAALGEEERARVIHGDATRPPPGEPCTLVLLDPPYGKDLVPRALAALLVAGWITPGALVAAEVGKSDPLSPDGFELAAERAHGAARLVFLRAV